MILSLKWNTTVYPIRGDLRIPEIWLYFWTVTAAQSRHNGDKKHLWQPVQRYEPLPQFFSILDQLNLFITKYLFIMGKHIRKKLTEQPFPCFCMSCAPEVLWSQGIPLSEGFVPQATFQVLGESWYWTSMLHFWEQKEWGCSAISLQSGFLGIMWV